jgi:SAM-dependent methyltransferase
MTVLTGAEFFDQAPTHAAYQARREGGDAPNELMEQDAFDQVLGNVQGLNVLDLGCGDARYGRLLVDRGCRSYLGVDASGRMTQQAERALDGTCGRVIRSRIEDFALAPAAFDVVISRMTFHWLQDLHSLLDKIWHALLPAGKLVFSVEHPVLTCCDAGRVEGQRRTCWVVDDYFVGGPRTVDWLGAQVVKYHRSVEEYFQSLRAVGFRVDELREATPSAARFPDASELRRRQRVPLMLLLGASRPNVAQAQAEQVVAR